MIEDNEDISESLVDIISLRSNGRHEIVAKAYTKLQACNMIDSIIGSEIEIDVIIMDGNLDSGGTNGEDAKEILERINDFELPTKIIGFSTFPFSDYGLEVDYDLTKSNTWDIVDVIDSL